MSTPFLSEIRIMSFNFAPKGWTMCNGQLLPINQNQPLFALLGTTYGGDGRVNFALPNLQARIPIHMGGGFTLGQLGGENSHTLSIAEMATAQPSHQGHGGHRRCRQSWPPAGPDQVSRPGSCGHRRRRCRHQSLRHR